MDRCTWEPKPLGVGVGNAYQWSGPDESTCQILSNGCHFGGPFQGDSRPFSSEPIRNYLENFIQVRQQFLPARRYASAGNSDRNVYVCPSVTRRYCVKTKKASGMISSPSGSSKTLVF